jgi:diaminohydroxyphosphoribosylaminopyrimidine deaminase/5-amino-6-(5-phosphoribosylamino)uracil reductase
MFSPADEHFMTRALELAARGLFTTTPNPRVGSVIVRDGAIVGEGFHARAGQPHAETNALRAAGRRAAGDRSPRSGPSHTDARRVVR